MMGYFGLLGFFILVALLVRGITLNGATGEVTKQ